MEKKTAIKDSFWKAHLFGTRKEIGEYERNHQTDYKPDLYMFAEPLGIMLPMGAISLGLTTVCPPAGITLATLVMGQLASRGLTRQSLAGTVRSAYQKLSKK